MKKLIISFILTIMTIVGYAQNITRIDGITALTGFWQFNIDDNYKQNDKLLYISSDKEESRVYKYIGDYIPSISSYKIHSLYITYNKFNLLSKILLDLDVLGNENQFIINNTVHGNECNDLYDYFNNQFNRVSKNTNPVNSPNLSILNFTWTFVNSTATLILYSKETKLDKVGFSIEVRYLN